MVTENLYINENCIVGQEYTDANQYLKKNKKGLLKKHVEINMKERKDKRK